MRYGYPAVLLTIALCGSAAAQDRPLPILNLDEATFEDKALAKKFRRIHDAAEKMAQEGWDRKPYETFTDPRARGVAYAHWCSFVEQDRRPPINYNGPRELNTIQLSVWFDPDPANPDAHKNIHGAYLYAKWKPATGKGWGAYLAYGETKRMAGGLHCDFYHYAPSNDPKDQYAGLELTLDGHAHFLGSFLFGEPGKQTHYYYQVTTWKGPRKVVLDDEVRRILKSPESLRDFMVVPHKELLKQVNTVIPEDKGYTATHHLLGTPSDRKLSDAEREYVLKIARDRVELQIRTVQEQYKELFAAQRKAFPLRECLE